MPMRPGKRVDHEVCKDSRLSISSSPERFLFVGSRNRVNEGQDVMIAQVPARWATQVPIEDSLHAWQSHTTPGLRPTPPHERRGKRLRGRDPLLLRGGENDCEVGMLFPSFFQGGVSAKPTGWLVWIYPHTTPGLRPTPPHERRGKRLRGRDSLLLRGGENDCEVGMLFPSFFQGGVSAKPTGVVGADLPPHHPRPAADPSSREEGEEQLRPLFS